MSEQPAADGGRWRQLEELFLAALDRPQPDRAAFVGVEAGPDEPLRDEVLAMLAAHESPATSGLERWLAGAGAGPGLAPPLAGSVRGPYRLLERLGAGGMGEVYLAERVDGQFRQTVALKLLRPADDDPGWVARFRAEREILARLEHPNIARLLDGGVDEQGLPYLVMEYVRGEPVTRFCDQRRLSLGERIRIFQEICRAAQHAHQNLVVHRDLKPSNILVNERGEVRLLDFGIAKILVDKVLAGDQAVGGGEATRTGLLMTPAFASPEQLRGTAVTTATDVYALGLLLYELLTGCPGQPTAGLTPAAPSASSGSRRSTRSKSGSRTISATAATTASGSTTPRRPAADGPRTDRCRSSGTAK